jgi:hypothetical protein
MQDAFSPERIADRMAIHDLMYRWCRSVDRLDFDLMRSVFHPDAYDDHGAFKGGVEELVAWIRERHRTITFSAHRMSNMLIEFADRDIALAETYGETVQRYSADGKAALAQLSGGQQGTAGSAAVLNSYFRYIDWVERRAGEWRIARRMVVQDWKRISDLPPEDWKPTPGWPAGRRDREDPLYLARAELGL